MPDQSGRPLSSEVECSHLAPCTPEYRCSMHRKGRTTSRRSPTEWAVLDALRGHSYDYRQKGGKPDDPGWHACSCGWEGYWCDYQPHVAEKIVEALNV